jgi:hypothetical protein
MSIERKANQVLEQAKQVAEKAGGWADFSAALFDYSSGLVTRTFPDETERQAFFESKQHEEINKMLIGLMKKHGVVNGAGRKEKSGKFVVRVAKTIHEKLETEAKMEGVSLNQLAVTKLALPLKEASKIHDSSAYELILDQGRIDGEQRLLLRLGRKRLGQPGDAIVSALHGIKDLDRLERLGDAVIDVASWQELLATP